jgi:hypothetical protein
VAGIRGIVETTVEGAGNVSSHGGHLAGLPIATTALVVGGGGRGDEEWEVGVDDNEKWEAENNCKIRGFSHETLRLYIMHGLVYY